MSFWRWWLKQKKSLHATNGHPVGITDVSLAALGWWKVIRESVTINFKKINFTHASQFPFHPATKKSSGRKPFKKSSFQVLEG